MLTLQPPEKVPWGAPPLGGWSLSSSPEPDLTRVFICTKTNILNPLNMIQKQNPYQKNSQNSSTNTAWEVNNSRVYSHFTNQRLTQFDPLCLKLRFFFFFYKSTSSSASPNCTQSFTLFELSTICHGDLRNASSEKRNVFAFVFFFF